MKHRPIEVTFTGIHQYITRTMICMKRLWPFVPMGLFLFFFSHSTLAAGIGNNVLQPYLNYTFTADDNMLRIRDKMDPQTLLGTNNLSDITQRIAGGVILEKDISRQRLSANLNWSYNKYERFTQMDNDARDFKGNWNWFLGNKLEGNMGASYVRALAPFLFQPGVKNIRTEQSEFINAAWRLHPSWSLHGDFTHYTLNTDSNIDRLKFLNRTENKYELGLDYVAPSESTVGILLRNIRGDFTDFSAFTPSADDSSADGKYDQKEILSKIKWIISTKSSLLGTGGWVERKNDSFTERNYSGFNARLTYHWQPTDKIGLSIKGWRVNESPRNLTARFALSTGISVVPTWQVTEKVKVEGDFSYRTINFERIRNATNESILGNHNTFRDAAIKLIYSPYLGLQLSTSVYHSHLTADSQLGGFNANGANINLQYIYGQR